MAADSGAAYPVDPLPRKSRLPYPQPRDEHLRYRVRAVAPGEEFDQTGFEWPPTPEAATEAAGQRQLFSDDYVQPDASDQEPVFWSDANSEDLGFRDPRKPDDFVQPDAVEAV
ncbi:MAG: hypothetical protein HY736_05450 [Verrucomicrobia bacterium]|nr:hypothetical protein [Verrucomicrobiota bacterium]